MRTHESWYPGHLQDLDEQECRALLAATDVGRVAWYDGTGAPIVLPVNYVLDGDHVVFRTSPHSVLARTFRDGPKAFQIDDHDSFQQSGWSVLVRGESEVVDYDDLPEERPEPWVGGSRNVHVRIRLDEVTGRRVLPG
jgi:nitroimidazol reductase NimA-like FMN-containing flavoprotein (pyridoxamine 5'-phosphate oxidase superfamily)